MVTKVEETKDRDDDANTSTPEPEANKLEKQARAMSPLGMGLVGDGGSSPSVADDPFKKESQSFPSQQKDASENHGAPEQPAQADEPSAAIDSAEPPSSEDVAALPGPPQVRDRPDADATAKPPGRAPAGDARSFRRHTDAGEEFALVYRSGSYLITRRGIVGREGAWTCTEYPHQGAASHAYAHRCSELTGEGFRDLR